MTVTATPTTMNEQIETALESLNAEDTLEARIADVITYMSWSLNILGNRAARGELS